jgi:hypothetical protein
VLLADLLESGLDPVLTLAGAVAAVAWMLAAGVVFLVRRPAEPSVGPRTLDLGPEPPALANFLVNDFRVTPDAEPATLLDLAARRVVELEERGPGVYYVRLHAGEAEGLTSYERRVLDHLEQSSREGIVPTEALTTGTGEQSKRWFRAFAGEVIADAKGRGLSRDALDRGVFVALGAAAFIPAVLVWILSTFQAALVVMVGAVALLAWIRARHPQRETTQGLEAASRWLGVRAALADDEMFKAQTPVTVGIWNRHLAYGAALGVASGAIGPLPMGAESDDRAWSAYGGTWHAVRVRYPVLWPPGWGRDPLVALVVGAGVAVVSGLVLYGIGPSLFDEGGLARALLLAPCAGIVLGVGLAIMALGDLQSTVEIRGQVLRLRARGSDEKTRYYAAVDDGSSSAIRAYRVSASQYQGLTQGEIVTARVTRSIGCVRSISGSLVDGVPAEHAT